MSHHCWNLRRPVGPECTLFDRPVVWVLLAREDCANSRQGHQTTQKRPCPQLGGLQAGSPKVLLFAYHRCEVLRLGKGSSLRESHLCGHACQCFVDNFSTSKTDFCVAFAAWVLPSSVQMCCVHMCTSVMRCAVENWRRLEGLATLVWCLG